MGGYLCGLQAVCFSHAVLELERSTGHTRKSRTETLVGTNYFSHINLKKNYIEVKHRSDSIQGSDYIATHI